MSAAAPSAEALSVVVPTRDRATMLERCLKTIRIALRPGDELIVVDSASKDGDAIADVARAAGATVARCERAGASVARNRGWHEAAHEVVAFIDDDVCVESTWADAIARAFVEHPQIAYVAGRLNLPPELVVHERPVAYLPYDEPRVLDLSTQTGRLGHSANLAVRRSVLAELRGFDELLGAGVPFRAAEDIDLLDRILLTGRVGRYEPGASAWHDQWRSRWELVRLDWGYGLGGGVRIAKLARSMPSRASREAAETLWGYGLVEAWQGAKAGNKMLTLTALARAGGTVVGMARGSGMKVARGHLAPRHRLSDGDR